MTKKSKKPNLSRSLVSLRAFYETEPHIPQMFEWLALKPISNDWRIWTDWLGHSLTIQDDKKIKVSKNPTISIQDLYHKASLKKLAEISNKIVIAAEEDKALLWLFGLDKRLRMVRINKIIENLPPLNCNLFTLEQLFLYLNNGKLKIDIEKPLQIKTNAIISSLPLQKNKIEKLQKLPVGQKIIKEIWNQETFYQET